MKSKQEKLSILKEELRKVTDYGLSSFLPKQEREVVSRKMDTIKKEIEQLEKEVQ